MFVSVASFGSLWRHRFSGDQNAERRLCPGRLLQHHSRLCTGNSAGSVQRYLAMRASANAAVLILTTLRPWWAECLIVQNLAFGKERTNSISTCPGQA